MPDPAVRRVRRFLDVEPVGAFAGAIGAVDALRDNALET
jgi:hypothetical protein